MIYFKISMVEISMVDFYGVSMVEFKQVNVGQGNPGLLQVPISIVTRF